jgi:hypothetical protein
MSANNSAEMSFLLSDNLQKISQCDRIMDINGGNLRVVSFGKLLAVVLGKLY